MAKYFTNIPLQPENVRPLREAIIKNLLEDEDIRRVLNIKKVRSGEPLAVIGEMDAVGHAGAGCSPTFDEIGIANAVKRWDLGPWSIALEICYENLEETIAEYCLKSGTAIGDLTDTDFMSVYLELLTNQMKRLIWRVAWFGDTAADTIANGGNLTNGTDKTLFTICDGLFKRLETIATGDPTKLTDISAVNGQASYAAQDGAMAAPGTAIGIVDQILIDAQGMINANGEGVLMLNKKFADRLAMDIRNTFNYVLPWERIFEGVYVSQYNGVKVASVAVWDWMINQYFNTGTAWYLPYRAVFANPRNLILGCDAENPVSDLDIWFNKDERKQKIYAAGKMDTNVAIDDLVHVAY